ncbi:glycosyltransferase [Dysgonomonas sp. 520]|uniref:glycosyltransferase n=1 Tax=Dysgonomonas sp. 520 TaxID=2302931 RepID=UPI0013D366CA|nr:glycosyltransferase [Dysgonomonas sp. 520]NDW08962.1 glycosyltransferase [Dysgonomonas sp. 520]
MLLSIIIAMYNTEKYIAKCLNSILTQGLKANDYEIIVIDDGSTDKGADIVEKLTMDNPNIILIKKENGGQSSARNMGFDIARGEYVMCVDSDDYLEPNSLIKLLSLIKKDDLDVASFNFNKVDESGTIIQEKKYYSEHPGIMTGADFMCKFVIVGAMCLYIFKKELIDKHNLRLIEGIFQEDEEFIPQLLSYAKRVKYLDIIVYNYLERSNSTTQNKSIEHRAKLLNDLIVVISHLQKRIKSEPENAPIFKAISRKTEQLSLSICLRLIREKYPEDIILDITKQMKQKKLYPLNYKHLKASQRAIACMINLESLFLFSIKR